MLAAAQGIEPKEVTMKRVGLFGLALACILSTPALGFATTLRSWRFHGSACRPSLSSETVRYSQYGVENTSTSVSETVDCAIPLETVVSNSETLANQAQVTFYDRGASARVSCTFYGFDTSGNVVFSDTRTSSSGGIGTGLQSFLFNPSAVSVQSAFFMISCSLPANNSGWPSHIVSMTVFTQF
jgi:hypothetical protein